MFNTDVVCAGVIVADHISSPISHLPGEGELVPADILTMEVGGCAANASIALARLGYRPSIAGRVGNDSFGRFVTETLRDHRVDVSELTVDPVEPTSQTLIINVVGQDRRFIHSFGANRGFCVEDLELCLMSKPKVLYLGGFLVLPGLEASGLGKIFERSRSEGCIVALDVVTPGPGPHLELLSTVLPHVDLFLPNTDEAALILGETDPARQARAFRRMGAKTVIITQGARGAIYLDEGQLIEVGTYKVKCVDPTGGGDAFDAGYIAGLIEGRSAIDCLRLASAMGASCVRSVGATQSLFNLSEAEAFISCNDLELRID